MNTGIQQLYNVWALAQQRTDWNIRSSRSFEDIANTLVSTGPFYYYVIDFADMSLSHISPAIHDIHGLNPENVSFNQILQTIHPEDIDFVSRVEKAVSEFFRDQLGPEKLMNYKINYSFRSLMKDGNYGLLNHQAIMLSTSESGQLSKFLNIHTKIDHLSTVNTYKYSLIGLNGEPSFMNLDVEDGSNPTSFSSRETEIIKLLAEGLNNNKIGEKLFISPNTVKKHRFNILSKAHCSNTAQLIRKSILEGLI